MYEAQHIDRSRKAFGKPWIEVHRFLDQYFPQFGMYHRIVLHHQRGIDLVVARFGEDARLVAEQHILDDQKRIPEDWRDFDFDLNMADHVLSKKTALKRGALAEAIKEIFPDLAHLVRIHNFGI